MTLSTLSKKRKKKEKSSLRIGRVIVEILLFFCEFRLIMFRSTTVRLERSCASRSTGIVTVNIKTMLSLVALIRHCRCSNT